MAKAMTNTKSVYFSPYLSRGFKLILWTILLGFGSHSMALDAGFKQKFQATVALAKQGDARAMYKLGNAYYSGLGVKANLTQAKQWYQRAAAKGYHKASYKLGLIHSEHNQYKAAARAFRKAAQNRFPPAQYELAKLYFHGRGLRTSKTKALLWAKRSEANGYRRANLLIAKLQQKIQTRPLTKSRKDVADNTTNSQRVGKIKSDVKSNTESKRARDKRELKKKQRLAQRAKRLEAERKRKQASDKKAKFEGKSGRTRNAIISGRWSINGKPSEFLPSSLNKCVTRDKDIDCKTGRKNKVTPTMQIDFLTKSMMYNFRKNGQFTVRYQKQIVFVLPMDDVDNPEPNPNTPKVGPQKMHVLNCRLVNKSSVECKSRQNKTFKLSRN